MIILHKIRKNSSELIPLYLYKSEVLSYAHLTSREGNASLDILKKFFLDFKGLNIIKEVVLLSNHDILYTFRFHLKNNKEHLSFDFYPDERLDYPHDTKLISFLKELFDISIK